MAIDSTPFPWLRCLGVWTAVTALGTGLVSIVVDDLRPAADPSFEHVLVTGASWVLCLAVVWVSAVTGLVALEAARPTPIRRTGLPGVPRTVRRVVLRACGMALAGGLVAGMATTPATATAGSTAGSTDQAPAPPAGPVSAGPVVRTDAPASPERVTSQVGDSLWRVAEAELREIAGRQPGDAAIAAYWPRIHATNRVLLGPDPDFLLPGVPLALPAVTSVPPSVDKEQS